MEGERKKKKEKKTERKGRINGWMKKWRQVKTYCVEFLLFFAWPRENWHSYVKVHLFTGSLVSARAVKNLV